ncbi:MAG: thiamine phosphate synthase [Acidobacteria bacterium]|nr:thiamine phosphate synthase [Acidobacteriota bacterium]
MIRYSITDRKQLGGIEPLLQSIARNIAEGVEYIQIREKDLPVRELTALVRKAIAIRANQPTRILVNTRADIAIACGADGVHLPSDSPILNYRIPGFLTAVSCHTIADLIEAEQAHASFAVFGPVFAPLSKSHTGPTTGLAQLREATKAVRIPVFALGGITHQNAPSCIEAGAAGIAAITLFQSSQ